jgi:hypothetical protein
MRHTISGVTRSLASIGVLVVVVRNGMTSRCMNSFLFLKHLSQVRFVSETPLENAQGCKEEGEIDIEIRG